MPGLILTLCAPVTVCGSADVLVSKQKPLSKLKEYVDRHIVDMNVFQDVESHRHMHPGSCDRNFRKDRGAQVFGSRLRQNQRKRWSKSWVSSEGGNQVMGENLVLFCFSLMSLCHCRRFLAVLTGDVEAGR